MKPLHSALALALLSMPALGHPHDISQGTAVQLGGATVTLVYEHPIPGMPGKSLKGVVVDYEPGGASPSHTHAPSAIIYATVIEGAVHCQLNNGPVRTYRAGENWTEMPGDHHNISANASQTERARVLAVFVVDTNDLELTRPDRR